MMPGMSVEVFNTTAYLFESAAYNAEFAVFVRNFGPYILESPAVNASQAVFAQYSSIYELDGRGDTPGVYLHDARIYGISGHALGKVSLHYPRCYALNGHASGEADVAVHTTNLYMITTN